MKDKTPILSVTKKDFRFDFYKGSGAGGQKRNKTENCCRITHIDSGAVGKSEDGRSKQHNIEIAFKHCVETPIFQKWLRMETMRKAGELALIEEEVERSLKAKNIKIEVHNENGLWKEVKENELIEEEME